MGKIDGIRQFLNRYMEGQEFTKTGIYFFLYYIYSFPVSSMNSFLREAIQVIFNNWTHRVNSPPSFAFDPWSLRAKGIIVFVYIIQLVGQKHNNKASKCKLKNIYLGIKGKKKTGEFCYQVTITSSPLVPQPIKMQDFIGPLVR